MKFVTISAIRVFTASIGKTLLVNRLVEAAALIFVNFEATADDGVAFVLEDQIGNGTFWRHLVCLAEFSCYPVIAWQR